jgi:hypothetical protein
MLLLDIGEMFEQALATRSDPIITRFIFHLFVRSLPRLFPRYMAGDSMIDAKFSFRQRPNAGRMV